MTCLTFVLFTQVSDPIVFFPPSSSFIRGLERKVRIKVLYIPSERDTYTPSGHTALTLH